MTTNYGAASLVAKLGSSKTTDQPYTHTQHGALKLTSVNAGKLKNTFILPAVCIVYLSSGGADGQVQNGHHEGGQK